MYMYEIKMMKFVSEMAKKHFEKRKNAGYHFPPFPTLFSTDFYLKFI